MSEKNSAKRLPIVFVLDVSPSMNANKGGSSSIELLNASVNNFIRDIKSNVKAKIAAEIAFVTYSSMYTVYPFEPARTIENKSFETVDCGSTQTAQAVIKAIELLEDKKMQYKKHDIPIYSPFLVLVTDGNPDDNDNPQLQEQAINSVQSHCYSSKDASNIIIPFIIGVGDKFSEKTKTVLTRYSEGFTNGFFHLKGNADELKTNFSEVFKIISHSVKHSVNLNKPDNEIFGSVQKYTIRSGKKFISDL